MHVPKTHVNEPRLRLETGNLVPASVDKLSTCTVDCLIVIHRCRKSYEKANTLDEDGQDVHKLEGDKDKERRVVASSNARIDPWTVMIVSLDASLAHIAMVAPRDGYDLALEAELVYFESVK